MVNARGRHFFPPGGVTGSPRRASAPRLQALSSQRGGGNGLLCWPCFSLCHLPAAGVLCPVQTEAWVLLCSQTKAGERPQPRPASGTLRATVDVSVLVARGVSSAPPACSPRARFPPAQYQDPTSFQSVLETPGPKGLPGLRIPIDPRLLASFGAFWGPAQFCIFPPRPLEPELSWAPAALVLNEGVEAGRRGSGSRSCFLPHGLGTLGDLSVPPCGWAVQGTGSGVGRLCSRPAAEVPGDFGRGAPWPCASVPPLLTEGGYGIGRIGLAGVCRGLCPMPGEVVRAVAVGQR